MWQQQGKTVAELTGTILHLIYCLHFTSSAGSMWTSWFCKCRCNCRLRMRPVTSRYVSASISATALYFDVICCQSLCQYPSNKKKIKQLVWQRVHMLLIMHNSLFDQSVCRLYLRSGAFILVLQQSDKLLASICPGWNLCAFHTSKGYWILHYVFFCGLLISSLAAPINSELSARQTIEVFPGLNTQHGIFTAQLMECLMKSTPE